MPSRPYRPTREHLSIVADIVDRAADAMFRHEDERYLDHPMYDPEDRYDAGYCRHGKYVGGCGVDWMCGPCEGDVSDAAWLVGGLRDAANRWAEARADVDAARLGLEVFRAVGLEVSDKDERAVEDAEAREEAWREDFAASYRRVMTLTFWASERAAEREAADA